MNSKILPRNFKDIIYITKQHYENCINYININNEPKFNRDNGSDISILQIICESSMNELKSIVYPFFSINLLQTID